MNTDMTWQTDSTSSSATERVAEKLGRNLRGGEVIELVSDLGGGKTTFVRGLARGLGSPDKVTSPTFKISNEYSVKHVRGSTSHIKTLIHFDFYRLPEPGLIANELAEATGDPQAVVVVEWADIVKDVLPAARLSITFKPTSENGRHLEFTYPESLAYLLEEII